jgi:biopolymer transport protein ExbB
MWALLFCSVLVVACLFERGFRLRRNAFSPTGMAAKADALWKQGKFDEILKLCDTYPNSTLSKVLRFIVENRRAPADALNDAIGEIAGRDLTLHYMLAYPVLAVATISPLLGLFGTVLGLIDSFETVSVAGYMGDPSLLAGGISKGLVCTAFGLLVAIPSLFSYHMLRLRTRYLNQILEKDASLITRAWLWKNEEVKS